LKKRKNAVRFPDVPSVIRRCKKCSVKTEFDMSGLFRINANKKSLDVWLIYRCSVCDSTWNFSIYTRISPQAIEPELLDRFHENDLDLAVHYATDTALLKRNGAITKYHNK